MELNTCMIKTDKEKRDSKKLSKSLVDMENTRFTTQRQIQAVNEVLALVTEESNPRVFARAQKMLKKLSYH